ncbi:glyoxysomal processing protease, glyoxysomal isoform X1 [Panicum miliaceum]|uniref:Glyoxysomal processing protease, glyoxysomal isoform X1 n=1 Tax=Panicum miliaceum TaxID=4540 RepID=A0A3L6RBD0_PANMI|nr:glyoxysomal processing protease, glyoxysomal isoform X1 [Panicum miliaceum]
METQEIAAAARHFAAMARIVGPQYLANRRRRAPPPVRRLRFQDPKGVKMRRHAFHLHQSGSTTLSASALLLPRGALAEPPPLLDHVCAARGHAAGDVALTAASLVEPFLVAEQRGNPGEEFQPRLVPEARIDVLVEHEELGNTRDGKSGPPRWLSARLLAMVDVPTAADSVLSLLKHDDSFIGRPSWDIGWSLADDNQKQVENDIRSSLKSNRNNASVESIGTLMLAKSATRIAILGISTINSNVICDQNARRINVSEMQHRGDSLLVVGSPFGLLSPFHFFNSISVGAVANCLPPCAMRSSLLMADIHCLPGMEGGPVFDKNSCLVGLLMNPLRQKGSNIEVQLVVPWDAICTGWNNKKLEEIGGDPSLCSSLSSGVVSKVVQIPSIQLSHLSGTVEADNMDMPVMLQTTAAVHPGASGGVLVNSHGLMVGIITSNAKHGAGSTIPHLNFSIPCKSLETIFKYSEIGEPAILEELDKPNEVLSSIWALAPSSSPFIDNPPEKTKDEKVLEFSKFLSDKQATLKSSTDLKELFKHKIPSKI